MGGAGRAAHECDWRQRAVGMGVALQPATLYCNEGPGEARRRHQGLAGSSGSDGRSAYVRLPGQRRRAVHGSMQAMPSPPPPCMQIPHKSKKDVEDVYKLVTADIDAVYMGKKTQDKVRTSRSQRAPACLGERA